MLSLDLRHLLRGPCHKRGNSQDHQSEIYDKGEVGEAKMVQPSNMIHWPCKDHPPGNRRSENTKKKITKEVGGRHRGIDSETFLRDPNIGLENCLL